MQSVQVDMPHSRQRRRGGAAIVAVACAGGVERFVAGELLGVDAPPLPAAHGVDWSNQCMRSIFMLAKTNRGAGD
jgi:hypothetical protein